MSDISPATDRPLIALVHEKGVFVYSHAFCSGPLLEEHGFTEAIMPTEVRFISADKSWSAGNKN